MINTDIKTPIRRASIKKIRQRLKVLAHALKTLKMFRRTCSMEELIALNWNDLFDQLTPTQSFRECQSFLDSRIAKLKFKTSTLHVLYNILRGKNISHSQDNTDVNLRVKQLMDDIEKDLWW